LKSSPEREEDNLKVIHRCEFLIVTQLFDYGRLNGEAELNGIGKSEPVASFPSTG
jgi:hypothetical protein